MHNKTEKKKHVIVSIKNAEFKEQCEILSDVYGISQQHAFDIVTDAIVCGFVFDKQAFRDFCDFEALRL